MRERLLEMHEDDLLLLLDDEHESRYRQEFILAYQNYQGAELINAKNRIVMNMVERILSYGNYIERIEVLWHTHDYNKDLRNALSRYPSVTETIELLEEHLDIYENMLEELKNLERREYE